MAAYDTDTRLVRTPEVVARLEQNRVGRHRLNEDLPTEKVDPSRLERALTNPQFPKFVPAVQPVAEPAQEPESQPEVAAQERRPRIAAVLSRMLRNRARRFGR